MSTLKFRGNAVMAVERDATGIRIWFRKVSRPDGNGNVSTVEVLPEIALRWEQVSAAVKEEGFGHGMEQRLRDRAAQSTLGKQFGANVQEKWEAVKELADHYASGTESWTMAAAGGGSLSADTRALILAVQRALGLEAEAAETAVRDMTTAQRDALRTDDEIKPHLDAIYAERAKAAGASTEGLKEKLRALRA